MATRVFDGIKFCEHFLKKTSKRTFLLSLVQTGPVVWEEKMFRNCWRRTTGTTHEGQWTTLKAPLEPVVLRWAKMLVTCSFSFSHNVFHRLVKSWHRSERLSFMRIVFEGVWYWDKMTAYRCNAAVAFRNKSNTWVTTVSCSCVKYKTRKSSTQCDLDNMSTKHDHDLWPTWMVFLNGTLTHEEEQLCRIILKTHE